MSSQLHVFVTGGSGFVGCHLIRHLCQSGHAVSALARSPQSVLAVQQEGAQAVQGDLASVQPAMLAGCDAVIHAAAVTDEWAPRAHFWQGNVEGTQALLRAVQQAGVRRLIHVGTEAAFFTGSDLVHINETRPYPQQHRYDYAETKARAEHLVLNAASESLTTLSIRPRLVWGPGDTTVLPALIRMARAGGFSWIDQGRFDTSTTHVRNLVHALTLALDKGQSGQAYFVADDGTRTLREFLTALAATQGVDLGQRSLPAWLVRGAARGLEGVYRSLGIRRAPPITRLAADMLSSHITVDATRARLDLGYEPVMSVAQGLRELKGPQPGHASP